MNRIETHRRECGSVMLESLFGLVFLLFVLLALLQLFQMISRQMLVDYASFYGAKALSLGYAGEICRKGVRIAAMGASGRDVSSDHRVSLKANNPRNAYRIQAERYMQLGRASGVEYEYWYHDGGDQADLRCAFSPFSDNARCTVTLENAPLLFPAMKKLLSLRREPDPTGEAFMYNYARDWLDE